MVTFKAFLSEAASSKLMHLTHLEDLALDGGAAGAQHAYDVLLEFGRLLEKGGVSKALNVTVKWDGAPSVVFGPDPADGRFFVATKAAFSKTPKLMKTHQDIHDTYGDGGVADKLHACLSELAALNTRTILQGDLLFTNGEITTRTIDDKTYHTFRPNTILYAVDSDSELGQRIARAQVGLVIHTMYAGSGRNFETYSARPITPSIFSQLRSTNRVVALDATFDDVSGSATFTESEQHDFVLRLDRVMRLMRTIPTHIFETVASEPCNGLLNMFFNARIRSGAERVPAVDDVLEFIEARRLKERDGRSSEKGRESVDARFAAVTVVLTQPVMTQWFELHHAIAVCKNLIVRKLGQMARVQSFIPTPDGFRVTGPEGFVAVSHDGRMVKLVDRLEFSRANFLVPKEWQ